MKAKKMKQDVEALRGENKENIETLQGEKDKLTSQNESLEKATREKEQEHETLKETIETLQGDIYMLTSENESLEKTAKEEQKSQIERLTKVQNELDTTHKFFKSMKAYSHNLELEHEKLKTEREKAVRCIAELEQKIQSDSIEHELEKERIMNRIKNLQKQLETSAQEHEKLSVQIQSHEAEKKEHSILSDRFTALEEELQSTIEKSKSDRKLHLDLKMRLVEITMKNQAERANLDNRLFKLNKVL
jgi:chromosome segregation ATPase